MNKKQLLILALIALAIYLNSEKPKPNKSLLSEPWIIPPTPTKFSTKLSKKPEIITANSPEPKPTIKLSNEPETDYSWLTDDNLEFILKQDPKIQAVLKKANQSQRKFSLRTDLANIYNCFYKALSKQDWDLPEFLTKLEKAQYTLFPLRVNGNHWGLFILHNLTWLELEANYLVYYTSSGGGDLSQEKRQLQPFISQIVGEGTEIEIITPKDRDSKGYECGIYLVFYVREILERRELKLEKTYTSAECQEFRRGWKERIGESWGRWG